MSRAEDINAAYTEIQEAIGSDYISDKDFVKASYSRNVDPAFPDRWADLIVRPESPEEISEIVKIANKYKIPITPRGGGADLVGGSTTDQGILLDLTRLNKIIEVDEDNFFVIVEASSTFSFESSSIFNSTKTTGPNF